MTKLSSLALYLSCYSLSAILIAHVGKCKNKKICMAIALAGPVLLAAFRTCGSDVMGYMYGFYTKGS